MKYSEIKKYLQDYLSMIRPYRISVILMFVFFIINSFFEAIGLGLLIPIINFFLNSQEMSSKYLDGVKSLFIYTGFNFNLFNTLIVFLAIVSIKNIFVYLNMLIYATLRRDLVFNTSNKIFNNLMRVSYSFFHSVKKGDLIYYVSGASCYLGHTLQHLVNMFTNIFMVIGYLILLFILSKKLLIISTGFLLLLFLVVRPFIKHMYKLSDESAKYNQDFNSFFIETIDGIKIIKTYAKEKFSELLFGKKWFSYLNTQCRIEKTEGIQTTLRSPITVIVILLLFVLLLQRYFKYPLSIISVYLLILYRFIPSIQQILMEFSGLSNTLPPVRIALEAAKRDNKPFMQDGTVEIKEFKKEIKFENVHFSYIKEKETLKSINITFEKNKITAIVGSTGAGKTTLTDLIMRLYDPASGIIYIDDRPLTPNNNQTQIKISSWRNLFSVVLQDSFIFNDTVKNNILFGFPSSQEFSSPLAGEGRVRGISFPQKRESIANRISSPLIGEEKGEAAFIDDVIEAAKLANAHNFIMELPDKYDTILGDRGIKLSGGQKQMLALARALIKNPQILILDEATSSLDNETERLIQNAIQKLRNNLTIIVIAHRLSTIVNADKIYVLENGTIVEEGAHEVLLARNSYYANYYKLQFKEKLS